MEDEKLQQVITNGYVFKMSTYISDGFNLVFKEPGYFIGYLLINGVISGFTSLLSIFGWLISIPLYYPLAIGYSIGADRIKRNEITGMNDFSKALNVLGPFLLLWLLKTLVSIIVAAPAIIYLVISLITFFKDTGSTPNGFDSTMLSKYFMDPEHARSFAFFMLSHMGIAFLLLIPLFVLTVSYSFAPYFVYFKSYEPWQAMEASRKVVWKSFFSFIVFFILLALINMVGALCLLLGLLVTIPATTVALFLAFDDIVGAREIKPLDDNISEHFIVSE